MRLDKKDIYSLGVVAIVFALIIWIVGFFYISSERNEVRDIYLEQYAKTQEIIWQSVVNTHKVGMSAYFDAYILKPDVIHELTTITTSADKAKRENARKKLYELLLPVYNMLQTRNVQQLHFHDKENNSILRFHQPYRFGDSLNASRPSVVIANKNLKPVFGFETGKVFSGFRNVFPIVWNNEHIGSVELSQSFSALKRELEKLNHNREYMFVIKKEAISSKLFEENKKLYFDSPIGADWVVEKDKNDTDISENIKNISKALKSNSLFWERLKSAKAFATEVDIDGHIYTVSAIPIIDVKGEYVAAFLGFSHDVHLEYIDRDFKSKLLYFSLMVFFATGVVVKFVYDKQRLDNEKSRLLTISQTIGSGMYVTDTKGRIKFINEAALNMLGLRADEVINNIGHYMFHVRDKNKNTPLEKCPIYLAIQTGNKYEGVDFFKRKNGEIFAVDVISAQLKENNEVTGSVVVFRDITERLKLEESLKELNRTLEKRVEEEVSKRLEADVIFKTIFENSPEGILIIDDKGVFKECNLVAARMLGYEESEIIGKKPHEISPDIQPDSELFSENAAKMLIENALKGEVQRFEWTHLTKDGNEKLFEVMLSPVFIGDKKEILVLWRDITQIKELQKEREIGRSILIQQSKLAEMGAMIGAIAHQWRQPLNAIWLMVQEAKMAYDFGEMSPEAMAQFKETIGEQIKFMTETIEDFRNFYKPSVNKNLFSVAKAIKSVLRLLDNQIKKDGITVNLEADDELQVNGFESEFKQVALNIINNAKDALMQNNIQNRTIDISVTKEDNEVVIAIRDNGGGIDEHLLKTGKLFEPYVTTKGEKGTGIGLSLGKVIIEQKMQGKLEARNVEGGAEFVIKLAA